MDAQIANTPNNPQLVDDIKPDIGGSYANALLSHKQSVSVKNNKENIMENTSEPQAQKSSSENIKQIDSDISKLMGDDDATFTPVISSSRKDRKVEKHRKHKHVPNGMIDKNDGHEKPDKKDPHSSKDKQKDVNSRDRKNQRDHSVGRELTDPPIDVKKIFVEAPLPKINPWQVKNAPLNAIEAPVEERVLQPPKQEINVNGSNSGISSINVKDKKRFNHKVRNYKHQFVNFSIYNYILF